MDDQIRSESSFFWKLSIQPTVFTAPFCESVKRSFHFEPKSGKAPYLWQCDVIEDMINGVVTMAIDIHRGSCETSTSPPPSGSAAVMDLLQRNRFEVLEQPRFHSLKQEAQEYSPGTSRDVEYRMISIHTPKYLRPLMSAFLYRTTDSIREKSMSQITSPLSCHWTMDSIYHDILPTAQPDPDSADVWFEFPEEVVPPEQQQQLPRSGGDGSVVTLGAHWCVISKYKSLIRWIEHERQVEEEQRRQEEERVHHEQCEAEMRFHHQQRMQHEMVRRQEMQRLHEMHRRQCPAQQAQMHVFDSAQIYRHTSPMQIGPPMPMPMPPLPMQGQPFFGDPHNPHFPQQMPARPFQRLPSQPPQQPQPYYHALFPGPQDPMSPQSHQSYQPQLPASWQPPQTQEAPAPPHSSNPGSSSPSSSRTQSIIRVRQFSSSTFRVLLQYLYTGQIGLTGEQQRKIDKYWRSHQYTPTTRNDDTRQQEQEQERSVEILEQGRVYLPASPSPLGSHSLRPQHHAIMSGGPSTQMAQDTPSDYTSALRWLPCSRIVAIHDCGGSLAMDPTHSSSCTWESLVHVSQVLGLQDLHGRATKALGYHCQMLVVRTIMHSGVAEGGMDKREDDEQGSRETMTTTSTTTPGLLDDAECQDRILELCKDIRSLFLDLQDIMAT
ncbi:hypothetical protein BG000_006523 [Podila horticola]|nr:hypothetical protein BG000_006523 [Podila horticola]